MNLTQAQRTAIAREALDLALCSSHCTFSIAQALDEHRLYLITKRQQHPLAFFKMKLTTAQQSCTFDLVSDFRPLLVLRQLPDKNNTPDFFVLLDEENQYITSSYEEDVSLNVVAITAPLKSSNPSLAVCGCFLPAPCEGRSVEDGVVVSSTDLQLHKLFRSQGHCLQAQCLESPTVSSSLLSNEDIGCPHFETDLFQDTKDLEMRNHESFFPQFDI